MGVPLPGGTALACAVNRTEAPSNAGSGKGMIVTEVAVITTRSSSASSDGWNETDLLGVGDLAE